jgi:hypothetical protein
MEKAPPFEEIALSSYAMSAFRNKLAYLLALGIPLGAGLMCWLGSAGPASGKAYITACSLLLASGVALFTMIWLGACIGGSLREMLTRRKLPDKQIDWSAVVARLEVDAKALPANHKPLQMRTIRPRPLTARLSWYSAISAPLDRDG